MSERYARLYHRFQLEFPAVYADDHLLAWWTRLLDVADASWPMHPPIPRAVPRRVLTRLVEEGLVLTADGAYTIRGLDALRNRLSNAGARGAAVRWQSERNAEGNAIAMPTKPDHTKPTTTPPPLEGRRIDGTNPRALGTNPRANGTAPRQKREAEKRAGMPSSVHDILRRAAAAGES